MYFVDIFILQPNFAKYGIEFTLDEFHFFLLVLSSVLICAGGYIINDYYDVNIDRINKPVKQIISKSITQQQAFNAYLILSFTGLAIGTYLSIKIDFWKLVTVFVIAIVLLYFYSASFKRTPLLGNIIVAFLAGLSIILILLFEPNLYELARPGDYYIAGICTRYILGISIFAYTLTMVREIVKDMEDVEGDKQFNARTMPIAWGLTTAKIISNFFLIITIAALGYLYLNVLDREENIYLYFLLTITIFLLFIGLRIMTAKTKKEFGLVSKLIKISMVAGICIMPVYYLITF